MTEKELTFEKNHKIYKYSHSHYYNWYKALTLNLLESENFTAFFVKLKTHDKVAVETVKNDLLKMSQLSFTEQLDDLDTFILLTFAWAQGFNTEQLSSTQRLHHFLTNYTIQKNDLIGINQMNADLNQALLQHFPKVRQQDLKLIYRLLSLQNSSDSEIASELTKLNQRAEDRTRKLLSLI